MISSLALRRFPRIIRFRQTMRWHIMRLVIGAVALGLAAHSAVSVVRDVVEAQNAQRERAVQIAESASATARVHLSLHHYLTLSEIIQEFLQQPNIVEIVVHDLRRDMMISAATGKITHNIEPAPLTKIVIGSTTTHTESRVGQIDAAAPVHDADTLTGGVASGTVIGIVTVTMAVPPAWGQAIDIALPSVVAFFLVLALLVPVAARTAKGLARPLGMMSDMAVNISQGNFDSPVLHTRVFEIRVLSRSLRRMASKLQEQLQRIHQLAYVDQVTMLPNRERFRHQCESLIDDTREKTGALLFIDLDRFKIVNDTLGHDAGDALLRVIAERLRIVLRPSDPISRAAGEYANPNVPSNARSDGADNMVARLGGDEFTVLLQHIRRPEDAASIARRLIEVICEPVRLKGGNVTVGASIGVALYPSDGTDYTTLLKHADMAMYAAKERGRGDYAFFSSEMNERMHLRLTLEAEMRVGLDRGEFEPFYQPKVETPSGRPVGVEALVRWEHPERGLLAPDAFIEIAEDSGLVGRIGEAVLRKACSDASRWAAQGNPITVAVNVSMLQFHDDDFVPGVLRILDEEGLPAHLLELELTESAAMAEPERVTRLIGPLKAAGVRLAIDDFGTGYSSLTYLTTLPFDAFKIDRSFISRLGTDEDARMIVRTILGMARSLNYLPIAEGVETEAQMDFLTEHGCTMAQGFLFAHPMPNDELTSWLADASNGSPRSLLHRLEREVGT